jgi:hypothetical protein
MAEQIKKKFIADAAIDGDKIKLLDSQAIKMEVSGVTYDLIKLDGDGKVQLKSGEAAVKADVTSLQGQIDNILSNTDPAALDSLTEVVSAFQTADNNLNQAITDLASNIKGDLTDAIHTTIEGLDDGLAQEILDRQAADGVLQSNIDSEVSTRESEVIRVEGLISDLDSSTSSEFAAVKGDLELIEGEVAPYVYADEAPPEPSKILGWKYKKANENVGVLGGRKINWYFFNDNADHDPLLPPSDLGFEKGITIADLQAGQFSFSGIFEEMANGQFLLQVYTKPRAGDTGWYHSRQTYSINPKDLGIEGMRKLFYIVNAPSSNPEGLDELEIPLASTAYHSGTQVQDVLGTDELKLIAIATNTIAPIGTEMYVDRVIVSMGAHSYNRRLTHESEAKVQGLLEDLSHVSSLLDLEEAARVSGDASLQSAVDSEEAARIAADSTLQSNIDSEEAARVAADSTLQSNIDSEEAARVAADSTLQSNIDSEEAARIAADSTLQSNIDTEEAARIAADSTLQSNIDTEEAARIAADSNLQSQIDNILSNTDPAALDSLTEIVSAFQDADGDLDQAITDLGSNIKGDLTDATYTTIEQLDDAIAAITGGVGANAVVKDGNSFNEKMVVGTNDDFDFELERNGTSMFALTSVEAAPLVFVPAVKSSSITLIDPLNNGKMFGFSMFDEDINPQGGREFSMGAFGLGVHDALSLAGPSLENESWVGSENSGMFIDGGIVKATDGGSYVAPDLYVGGGFADPDSTDGKVQSGNLILRTNDGYSSDGLIGSANSGDINIYTGLGALGGQRGEVNIDARNVIINAQSEVEVNAPMTMQGNFINDVRMPLNDYQAAPKLYVDQEISSLSSGAQTAIGTPEIEKFTLSATDVSNGYVDLAEDVDSSKYKRMQVFVGRLAMHLDDDFTLSSFGGVTRVTFAGSMASGGAEALAEGDVVYVRYVY